MLTACVTSKDCPTGQSCVEDNGGNAVCQLPAESKCTTDRDCGADGQCRSECSKDSDCTAGQKCSTNNTCAEPSQVNSSGNLIAPDGGVIGAGGNSNAGGTGSTGGTNAAGTGGTSCTTGEERCACFANNTCSTGLTCASQICVNLGTGGATSVGGTAATGGITGPGGSGTGATPQPCSSAAPCSWHIATPSTSPLVQAWSAMAYDAAHEQIVLFGGAASTGGGSQSGETWAWNGTTWTKLLPVTSPMPRWTHGMVYDDARQRIVMFGGMANEQVSSALNDTWEWDGTNWTQVVTSNAPSPRGVQGGLAYDSARYRVVLFGGGTQPGSPIYNDLWEYDGSNWQQVTTSASPSARVASALGYDPSRGVATLFGGGDWSPYFGDTWSWNGSSWQEFTPSLSPSARQSARFAYDSARSVLILYGGGNSAFSDDHWEWNGTSWSQITSGSVRPSARCCYGFAYDIKRSETVLFGGTDNATWIYGP